MEKDVKKTSLLERILDKIEKAGNALPDPVTIFFIISVAVLLISWIASRAGVSVVHPSTQETVPCSARK